MITETDYNRLIAEWIDYRIDYISKPLHKDTPMGPNHGD